MIQVASPKCPLLSFITHQLLEKNLSTPSFLTIFCYQLVVFYLSSLFPIISLSFFIINWFFLLISLSSPIVFHFQFHIVIPNCCPLLFLAFISSFPPLIHCSLSMSQHFPTKQTWTSSILNSHSNFNFFVKTLGSRDHGMLMSHPKMSLKHCFKTLCWQPWRDVFFRSMWWKWGVFSCANYELIELPLYS